MTDTMTDAEKLNMVLEAGASRRDERRRFLRHASGVAVAAGATSLLAACGGGKDDSRYAHPDAVRLRVTQPYVDPGHRARRWRHP